MNLNSQQNQFNISRGRRNKKGTFALKLTSLIDMFTILLVFLLKSYSAEGQIVTITDDLHLPESTSQMHPKTTSVISITTEWLLVDGRPVEKVENILSTDDLLIPSLDAELSQLKNISQGIGEISDELKGFHGSIAIQGDREIAFNFLKRVMLTCGQVGYNNMLLTVLQPE